MILEAAILNVKPGQGVAFDAAMAASWPLIAATPPTGASRSPITREARKKSIRSFSN